jgi:outer membrane protein assembly factor BamA
MTEHLKILGFIVFVASSGAWARPGPDSTLTVKDIIIRGNEATKEHVILREMSLKVGDRITGEALERDRDRIYSLQLFNKVLIETIPEGDSATLVVNVFERWYLFPFPIVGFRYRDLNKLYYGAGMVHQNFRGRNEKLYLSFALGYDRWISLTYQNPKLTDDDDIFFRSSISYQHVHNLSVSSGEYQQINFSSNLSLGKRFGLYHTLVGYVNYEVWTVSDAQVGRTVSNSGRDAFISLGGRYTYDSRDIREYPTEGMLLSATALKSGLGESEVNLMYYGYDARGYTLLSDEWSLGARTFGAFTGGGVVPPYRHVFFGYDERVRGYFYDVMEGENIVGGSVELRFPLLSPRFLELDIPFPQFSVLRYGLYAGFFADAGKIWFRSASFSSAPWLAGWGGGLHFLLPYSLVVRTEYALNDKGLGQFVLDFGVSF